LRILAFVAVMWCLVVAGLNNQNVSDRRRTEFVPTSGTSERLSPWAMLALTPPADSAPAAAQIAPITVDYPADGSIFPPDFTAPTFLWRDASKDAAVWRIEVAFGDGSSSIKLRPAGEPLRIGEIDQRCVASTNRLPQLTPQQAGTRTWRPEPSIWEIIKRRSVQRPATITVTGFRSAGSGEVISRGRVKIRTATEPVGAPIFFRDVPLMPSEAEKGVIKPLASKAVPLIAWRLRNVSELRSRLLMQGLHTCANCHSFSRDGKTLGMDLDGPQNDKGLYTIAHVRPQMSIRNENVIAWSTFRDKVPSEAREGFMSQVSPDGQHVMTTIKPRGTDRLRLYYVANFKDYRFLQVFYPTRGILFWYNRRTGQLMPLPGADDPRYVQANAVWSPDGSYLVFVRAEAREPYPSGRKAAEYANDPNEPPIQYDLYRIPFNGGKGGRAEPITGASRNGMSNSFPKITPDGRWIVFVQARNGMLMRPDGQLYIVPAAGGKARRMRCNTPLMNSWHSFSPNGRWMVFSSKSRSPYTQMFLTHIDENGDDSPPILIEDATAANRAVNIPEFVNIPPDGLQKIDAPAAEFYRLFDVAAGLAAKGEYEAAIAEWPKAIALSPKDARGHNSFGFSLARARRLDEAIEQYRRALEVEPEYPEAEGNLGLALARKGSPGEAILHLERALKLKPEYAEAHNSVGVVLAMTGKLDEAIAHYRKALELTPNYPEAMTNLGLALSAAGRPDEAIEHHRKALEVKPDYADAHANLGIALARAGNLDEAIAHLERAASLKPDSAEIHCILGSTLLRAGRLEEAAAALEKALTLKPGYAEAHYYTGDALSLQGRTAEALAQWRKALLSEPKHWPAMNQISWTLATSMDASVRNGSEAVDLAEKAMNLSGGREPKILVTLAAAYAEAGRFSDAMEIVRRTRQIAEQQRNEQLANGLDMIAKLFEAKTPLRVPPSRPPR
jgi:tetratricopeptide (TPR) repeat protein